MESLRDGVGMYEGLSPSDMEADVDAVFGSWMVVVGRGNARLFRAGEEASATINGGAMASEGGGFLRAIRKGGGRGDTLRGGMGVKVGSVGGTSSGNGREEGWIEDDIAWLVYDEEWDREGRGGSVWVVSWVKAVEGPQLYL